MDSLSIYLGLSVALAAVYIFAVNYDIPPIASHLFVFINPIVIISSVYLFLFFSKMGIQSKLVNYLSRSAFAVYLFHMNAKVWDRYLDDCYKVFTTNEGIKGILLVFSFLLAVYVISILIDQIRLLCWKPLGRKLDIAIHKSNDS